MMAYSQTGRAGYRLGTLGTRQHTPPAGVPVPLLACSPVPQNRKFVF